jgi:hypothetical protein
MRKRADLWLGVAVLIASAAILLSVPSAYVIAGMTIVLGLWDFATAEARDYRRSRLPYTIAALGLGGSAAIIGLGARLELSFFAMLASVLACAFCIDFFAAKNRSRKPKGK